MRSDLLYPLRVCGGNSRVEKWKVTQKKVGKEIKLRLKRRKKNQDYDKCLINFVGKSVFERYANEQMENVDGSELSKRRMKRFETMARFKVKPEKYRKPGSKWELECTLCNANAKTPTIARNHLKDHVEDVKKCEKIGKVMDIVENRRIGNIVRFTKLENFDPKRIIKGHIYKCRFCPFASIKRIDLWTHSPFHRTFGNVAMCSMCSFATNYRCEMQQHSVWHENPPIATRYDGREMFLDLLVWFYSNEDTTSVNLTRTRKSTSLFNSPEPVSTRNKKSVKTKQMRKSSIKSEKKSSIKSEKKAPKPRKTPVRKNSESKKRCSPRTPAKKTPKIKKKNSEIFENGTEFERNTSHVEVETHSDYGSNFEQEIGSEFVGVEGDRDEPMESSNRSAYAQEIPITPENSRELSEYGVDINHNLVLDVPGKSAQVKKEIEDLPNDRINIKKEPVDTVEQTSENVKEPPNVNLPSVSSLLVSYRYDDSYAVGSSNPPEQSINHNTTSRPIKNEPRDEDMNTSESVVEPINECVREEIDECAAEENGNQTQIESTHVAIEDHCKCWCDAEQQMDLLLKTHPELLKRFLPAPPPSPPANPGQLTVSRKSQYPHQVIPQCSTIAPPPNGTLPISRNPVRRIIVRQVSPPYPAHRTPQIIDLQQGPSQLSTSPRPVVNVVRPVVVVPRISRNPQIMHGGPQFGYPNPVQINNNQFYNLHHMHSQYHGNLVPSFEQPIQMVNNYILMDPPAHFNHPPQ